MSDKKTGCIPGGCGLLLTLVGIGVVISWLGGSPGPSAPDTESGGQVPTATESQPRDHDPGAEAYYVGKKACEKLLKAPATAKFSNPYTDNDTGWEPYGTNQWKVFGHVDAQNVFGAMLRNQWLAVVKLSGGAFHLLYLRVGDEESGPMPKAAR